MRVLIVDDDDFALSILGDTMGRMGYTVVQAHDGREAMDILRLQEIRLVITDWDMPEMNGLELCRAVRREDLGGYVYVIMLTGHEGRSQRMEGLCAGADDFLNKPLDPEELLVCLKSAERILALETRDLALFALAKLAESRDADTGSHVDRVQSYSRLIAQNLSTEVRAYNGVDDEYIRLLHQTSPLHDLGKVAVPDSVLLKPGRLTADEFTIMKTHTIVGARTLDAALQRFPNARFLQMARDIAATHHERFDGTGYPQGLAGEQIPMSGRIVAVADVYDVLTSRRVYKSAMTHEQAKEVLLKESGAHFDPEVIAAFLRAERQILDVAQRLSDRAESPVSDTAPIPTPAPADPSPCGLLVVEDDALLREHVVKLLSATGERVLSAENGREAMKLWRDRNPRVVISDWVMPEMDGVEFCRLLRASDESQTHFIMLTSHSDKNRLLDAYQAGVDDFVSKPFDPEELLARVRVGIRTAKLRDELTRKSAGSEALNAHLVSMNSQLERLSVTDELTGLFNRRHAMVRLQEQWALAERHSRPLSVAMIDIDHFKKINDTHGHAAGDAVLKEVVGILRGQTRGTDTLCRVGGEEFLIIFPLQTPQEASVCVERCRAAVENHVFEIDDLRIRATVSVGIAARTPELGQFTDLLKAADQALYMAKNTGRNRIQTADGATANAPAANETVTPPAAAGQPPIDADAMLKRCGGDPNFAAAIMKKFSTQAGGEVERIAGALTAGDAAGVGRLAHSLKSMSAYVAADAASNVARQIEELGRSGSLAQVAPLLERLRADIQEAIDWIGRNGVAERLQPA